MILTCPSCGTQYAVKDGAIPAQGRKVRCASCGHSWHQQPETEAADTQVEAGAPATPPAEAAHSAEESPPLEGVAEEAVTEEDLGYSTVNPIPPGATLVEPPMAIPVPPPAADDGWGVDGGQDDAFDPDRDVPDQYGIAASQESEPEQRRTWLMAILIGLLVVALLAAAVYFLAPDPLRRSFGLAAAAATPLQITAAGNRQSLASDNEVLSVSGRIINPSAETQQVPPIHAQVRDSSSGRVLHSWTISPPARTLPPGGNAPFTSYEMEVPAGGDQLVVTLGAPANT